MLNIYTHKGASYLALTGELWGVCCEYISVKLSRDIENPLYIGNRNNDRTSL